MCLITRNSRLAHPSRCWPGKQFSQGTHRYKRCLLSSKRRWQQEGALQCAVGRVENAITAIWVFSAALSSFPSCNVFFFPLPAPHFTSPQLNLLPPASARVEHTQTSFFSFFSFIYFINKCIHLWEKSNASLFLSFIISFFFPFCPRLFVCLCLIPWNKGTLKTACSSYEGVELCEPVDQRYTQ